MSLKKEQHSKVIIIGSGPAGYTAAILCGQSNAKSGSYIWDATWWAINNYN